MDPRHDLYSWSKQRREEAIREAVSGQAGEGEPREALREPVRVGSALSDALSLLR
jgi:hypothetical protein